MPHLAPLLLVYDAESPSCRGVVDWIRKRDRACLIVAFPLQNAELVKLAPEVAGLPLLGSVHGLDTRSRAVFEGQALIPIIFLRLPGWAWVAPLFGIPALAALAYALIRRTR
jgi:predicted DCC family thiol-disulfide oxidoreductase YuxK